MIFQVIRTGCYWYSCPEDSCYPISIDKNGLTLGAWGIEINSVEELMKFKEMADEEIIITTSPQNNKTPTIEIYDDYRE